MPRLLASLLGMLLALLLAEAALRLAGPRISGQRLPYPYDSAAVDRLVSGQVYIRFDPDLGWLTTPRVRWERDEVPYRHNRAGLRAEREYAPTPPPGATRYAAYGDSFTYCDEVEVDNCWTWRLEEELPNTEVLNLGVPGYGPDQAWLRYRRGGAAWQACAVLIGYTVENINRVVSRFRPFYTLGGGISLSKPRFVLEDDELRLLPNPARDPDLLRDVQWIEANLGPRDAWYFPGVFVANPFDRLETVRLARTAAFRRSRGDDRLWADSRAGRMYAPDGEAFQVVTEILSGFAGEARRDGATPVVLIFPRREEIESRSRGEPKTHAPLLDALRERDIPTIDLTDALGQAARRTSLGSLVDNHYRPTGNITVARAGPRAAAPDSRNLPGGCARGAGIAPRGRSRRRPRAPGGASRWCVRPKRRPCLGSSSQA